MFDYSHLEALLAVEREGGIDAAGRALGVSGSAISQRIKVLEERIGAIVVNRQKPVTPTAFGRNLCRHAETVILLERVLIDNNPREMSDMQTWPSPIRVAADRNSISTWFASALRAMSLRDSHILFDISIVELSQTLDLLKQGIALAGISEVSEPIQGYRSHFLGQQIFQAVMSPKFAHTHFKNGITIDAIQCCYLIRQSPQDNMYREWLNQNFGTEFELGSHFVPSVDGLVRAVMEDVAWAILPAEAVGTMITSGKLVELAVNQTIKRPLYWHYSRSVADVLRPMTKSVVEAASAALSKQPYLVPNQTLDVGIG